MTKLQEIEEALIRVNDAVFQNVCDAILYYTEPDYPDINRSGSTMGKQKVKKGRPDTYFMLDNGKYVLVEYTTQSRQNKSAFLKKVRTDIKDCLDEAITGIPLTKIEKIIYCATSSLLPKEHLELVSLCSEKGILLQLKLIDTLSMAMLSVATPVAKEFLGIAIDTGQILSSEKFIREYESNGFSTTLRNSYISKNEFDILRNAVASKNITILTGPPGSGKTRMAMELFKSIKTNRKDKRICYCISNKNAPIHDDLRTYIKDGKDYLLLIDDANRHMNILKSILPLLNEDRAGSLNIVITIRDYAMPDIGSLCAAYSPEIISLNSMTDEEITGMLKSEEFGIQNPDYIDRIIAIANGNPRLAVMSAKVAKEQNNLRSLEDVSAVYDNYFQNGLDSKVFTDQKLKKVLGIVSFFHSINRNDTEFCERIYRDFGITTHEFWESAQELERLEVFESTKDYIIIKIAEQVLGTYFFYLSFFREPVLDFTIILKNYFEDSFSRIRETVIPANNTFGYKKVLEKIDPFLVTFWPTIQHDHANAFRYFSLFWIYRQEDALAFVHERIHTLPVLKKVSFEYNNELEKKYNHYSLDKYLETLSNFYKHYIDNLSDAIELSFDYVAKQPDCYVQFVMGVKEAFLFSDEDDKHQFYRQMQLANFFFQARHQKQLMFRSSFFDIMPTLFKSTNTINGFSRKKNQFTFYRYTVPLTEEVKIFRKKVWKFLDAAFITDPLRAEEFLAGYFNRDLEKSKELLEFDLPYMLGIFKKRLSKTNFSHCHIVHDLLSRFLKHGINKEFTTLRKTFSCEAYQVYLKIKHNRLGSKEDADLKYSWEEYRRLRNEEIRKSFHFSNLKEFRSFYKIYGELIEWGHKTNTRFDHALDVILENIWQVNLSLGYKIVEYIISSGNKTNYLPRLLFLQLSEKTDRKYFYEVHELINLYNFQGKQFWLLYWFDFLPAEDIKKVHATELIALFKTAGTSFTTDLNVLPKFKSVMPRIVPIILDQIYQQNEGKKVTISLERQFFKQNIEEIGTFLPQIKKTYLQQSAINDHFESGFHSFLEIVRCDHAFLIEYIDFWSHRHMQMREHLGLSIVWKLDNAEIIIRKALDYLIKRKLYHLREDFANVFFIKGENVPSERSYNFLKSYLLANSKNALKVNMVFNCIRHSYPEKLQEILLLFLNKNPDFGIFTKLDWVSNYFFGSAKTSIGEIRADLYQKIIEILDKISKKAYRFSKHKQFLKEKLLQEKRYADQEHKSYFMTHDD